MMEMHPPSIVKKFSKVDLLDIHFFFITQKPTYRRIFPPSSGFKRGINKCSFSTESPKEFLKYGFFFLFFNYIFPSTNPFKPLKWSENHPKRARRKKDY